MLFNESSGITVQPHISERWSDFEVLFGSRGACGGCWCRWFRLKRSDYEKQKGESNRHAMKAIVDTGEIPGILAYQDDHPVVWCSIGLREMFPLLNRSRILKPVDEKPYGLSSVSLYARNSCGREPPHDYCMSPLNLPNKTALPSWRDIPSTPRKEIVFPFLLPRDFFPYNTLMMFLVVACIRAFKYTSESRNVRSVGRFFLYESV